MDSTSYWQACQWFGRKLLSVHDLCPLLLQIFLYRLRRNLESIQVDEADTAPTDESLIFDRRLPHDCWNQRHVGNFLPCIRVGGCY